MTQSRRGLRQAIGALGGAALLLAAGGAPRDPLKVNPKMVLLSTAIDVGQGLSTTLTEFFTGEKSEKSGIDLLLGLYRVAGDQRTLVASRDYNSEAGGFVSRGSLEVIDLDHDGTAEVCVEYHHLEQPHSLRIDLDVFRVWGDRLSLVWSGPIRVDTTDKEHPAGPSDREKYSREIDYIRTAAEGGSKIVFKKTISTAAGVPFDPPRALWETFDLAPVSRGTGASSSPEIAPR